MWSLSSQRERRTGGPDNFRSSSKTDFFNTIDQKQPSVLWADQSSILLLRNRLNRTASLLLRRTTLCDSRQASCDRDSERAKPVAITVIYHSSARACVQTAIGCSSPRMVLRGLGHQGAKHRFCTVEFGPGLTDRREVSTRVRSHPLRTGLPSRSQFQKWNSMGHRDLLLAAITRRSMEKT